MGELEANIQQSEKAIVDLTLPSGMDEYDTAAFTDRFIVQKRQMRLRIRVLLSLKSRLSVRCLNYAIKMERQLGFQSKTQGFLEGGQNEDNIFFKSRSEDVFDKLQTAAQLAVSGDVEDRALLLTEVRRALKAAADYFHKPVTGHVRCMDGKERLTGETSI